MSARKKHFSAPFYLTGERFDRGQCVAAVDLIVNVDVTHREELPARLFSELMYRRDKKCIGKGNTNFFFSSSCALANDQIVMPKTRTSFASLLEENGKLRNFLLMGFYLGEIVRELESLVFDGLDANYNLELWRRHFILLFGYILKN